MTTTVEELFEGLQTPDPSQKRDALESLCEYPCDDRILEAAANLFTDPDRGVREAASRLLVMCSSDKAASLVAAHIASPNIAVRNLAGDALVRMKGSAVKALLSYVDSVDKDIRKFAIDLLEQLPADNTAISRIADHLSDSDPNVLSSCVDAIGTFRVQKFARRLLTLYEHYEFLRPNIVYAMSKFDRKPSLQFLLTALSDENPVVQLAAAEALAGRNDLDTLKVLLVKLNSVSELAKPVVLNSIITLLGSLEYHGEVPKSLRRDLVRMLDDEDPAYITAAVNGLRHFVDGDILTKLLAHTGISGSIDSAIASTLKDYPDETLPLILEEAAHETRVLALGRTAVLLLQVWTETNFPVKTETMQRAVLFITRCFPRFDVETKITALAATRNLAAAQGVQLVRAALLDGEPAVRNYAIDLTAEIGREYFIEDLQKLSDDDEEVRLEAERA